MESLGECPVVMTLIVLSKFFKSGAILITFCFASYTSSSMVGSQKDITLQAEAIIMYFGLN